MNSARPRERACIVNTAVLRSTGVIGGSDLTKELEYRLSAHLVNPHRIAQLAGSSAATEAGRLVGQSAGIMQNAIAQAAWCDLFVAWAKKQEPRSLYLDIANSEVKEGAVYALTRGFYCKGLARVGLLNGAAAKDPHVHCSPTIDGRKIKIIIRYDARNIATTSGWNALLGRQFLTAFFRVTKVGRVEIECSALVIGQLTTVIQGVETISPPSPELHFSTVAEFQVERVSPPWNLDRVLALSEPEIKKRFARILRQRIVPNDHGGELSDLIATVTIEGRPRRAAFLLKGPGNGKAPMTFKHLGSDGGQLVRLFKEDVDLYVIQHCHEIKQIVVDAARGFAMQIGRPRQFMIIDGYATHQILATAHEL